MPRINNEEFVRSWVEAHKKDMNQSYVADALSVSRQAVAQRANYLRRKGVNLPKLSRTPRSLAMTDKDIEELNRLLKESDVPPAK